MYNFSNTPRPFSVLEADARVRRAETMPPVRVQRIMVAVLAEIEAKAERRANALARLMSRRAERARLAEGAEIALWTPFLGEPDDN